MGLVARPGYGCRRRPGRCVAAVTGGVPGDQVQRIDPVGDHPATVVLAVPVDRLGETVPTTPSWETPSSSVRTRAPDPSATQMSTAARWDRQKSARRCPPGSSPSGLKYRSKDCTVAAAHCGPSPSTAGADQLCCWPNGSVQATARLELVVAVGAVRHLQGAAEPPVWPRRGPRCTYARRPGRPPTPVSRPNPPVGVNAHATGPDTTAPPGGAVRRPGPGCRPRAAGSLRRCHRRRCGRADGRHRPRRPPPDHRCPCRPSRTRPGRTVQHAVMRHPVLDRPHPGPDASATQMSTSAGWVRQ